MMRIGAPQTGQTKVACGGAGVSSIAVVGAAVSTAGEQASSSRARLR
jgi:hypothetical protein